MLDNIITIGFWLLLPLYLSLFLFYLSIRHQKKLFMKAGELNNLSPRAKKFLSKYDYSKEKVLKKLETDEQRIRRVRIFFVLTISMISIYFLLRILDTLLLGRTAIFPNVTDYLLFLLISIAPYSMLLRHLLLQLNKSMRNNYSRLLTNYEMRE